MNHDNAHCIDFGPDCPRSCFRAQLVMDLKNYKYPVSWMHLKGTSECKKGTLEMNVYVDKLPESCECCPCNDDYYRCGLSGDLFDEHDTYAGRMKNCKLKQLADVVEVVRCKDCEHWDISWQNNYEPNYHYCPLVDGSRRGDFYCSDAERRGEQDG